jgi:transcriptional regulator with XRE-family HTH domain
VGRFKAVRQSQGLTLAEAAGRMGIDSPALSRLETGKVLNPTLATLHKCAEALGRGSPLTSPGRSLPRLCVRQVTARPFDRSVYDRQLLGGRSVVDRIRVIEGLRPESVAPLYCELLRQPLPRELEARRAGGVDELQVSQFVKEHVVEQKPTDGQSGPFSARLRTELLGRLSHAQDLRQSHPRRQGTQSNFPPPAVDVAEQTPASATVVEVNGPEPPPQLKRQPTQNDAHVFLADVMDAISPGGGHGEFDPRHHTAHRNVC